MGSRNEKPKQRLEDVQVPVRSPEQKAQLEAMQRELAATQKAKDDLNRMAAQVGTEDKVGDRQMDTDATGGFWEGNPEPKMAAAEAPTAEPRKKAEPIVQDFHFKAGEKAAEGQAFNKLAKGWQDKGELGSKLAEAYKKNDLNLAHDIEHYIDKQQGKPVIAYENEARKSGAHVDMEATARAGREASEIARSEIISKMSPDELKIVANRTGDVDLKGAAKVMMAQLESNGTKTETMAEAKKPEGKKEDQVKVTTVEKPAPEKAKKTEKMKEKMAEKSKNDPANLSPEKFNKWLKNQDGKLGSTLADAYKNNEKLARRIEAHIDAQEDKMVSLPDEDYPGEVYIDVTATENLRREEASKARQELIASMKTADELNTIASKADNAELKGLADQRLAQLKTLEQINENIA